MSEFFNVTLDKDVVFNDSVISPKTGWTSEKTHKEIIDKRITKFEELSDVDVTNKKNKQLVAYSEETGKFITIDGVDAGEITGGGMKQVSKMGIVGSPTVPYIVDIPINILDFKVPRVNLLKYELGAQNVIATKNTFSNGEGNDFKDDEFIVFDGKVHIKTEYIQDYAVSRDESAFTEYKTTLDTNKYKFVEGFDDFEDGVIQKLKVTAIPFDRILMPKGDMNLSNAEHIDYFKLIATGKNIKVVCSVDSGTTWKTFKTDKWVDVNFDIENVRAEGMTTEVFNSINDVFWNELITSKKIRFAYLFSMDNILDVDELDNLDLQFDGQGKWVQAMETEYKVVYASNSLLQIEVYFSNDIKINY
ncbi:signal peptidase II [Clostridium estertheticum]|uniref:Signal peptidase II n=1 Tax=Clostridium estertheticum TaxID=238834 RepID=A0AA47EME1_9CLOT|nr:signal peptidase II [Clostridium estertheticum]MBU3155194.1 signal peptidase II [Clostridium estertheticum]WAG61248.1 signal peptidase II [Clostridium estertheticum]